MAEKRLNLLPTLEHARRRDAYGFALRPQYVQRFREYAEIYKEEEEERVGKWKSFLEQQAESVKFFSTEESNVPEVLQSKVIWSCVERTKEEAYGSSDNSDSDGPTGDPEEEVQLPEETDKEVLASKEADKEEQKNYKEQLREEPIEDSGKEEQNSEGTEKRDQHIPEERKEEYLSKETKVRNTKAAWSTVRPSLSAVQHIMSLRVKAKMTTEKTQKSVERGHQLPIGETELSKPEKEESEGQEIQANGISDGNVDTHQEEAETVNDGLPETLFSLKEELELLVRGGVPKDLRGEVWQAFVGVKARRVVKYYDQLLCQENNTNERDDDLSDSAVAFRKWRKQIEKDLPRTFPGHPAINDHGRDSLRRILLAYARHNPSVGYCQAMNFFAGILLLLMPEENAFWTLVGIIDDYFEGYYTEEMIESQVDQLVFEDLMRERFPKLVNHLDYLGVQVAWITGPWFLSIFVNILPWESVLRVWDVILFEGNRVMLFRTALALMDIYGPALVTTKDAGDAITLLQSLTGSTFDSSQLVLTACVGYLAITEDRLEQLREKHRPSVLDIVEERSRRGKVWKDSKGLASKLYSFKHEPGALVEEKINGEADNSRSRKGSNLDDILEGIDLDAEVDSLPDLQEQVAWLKVELCRLLQEKRAAILRAEELETALMEMVKVDNRLLLSAKIEQMEKDLQDMRQALEEKKEQESAMLQVLMRVEQEQRITEEARLSAENEASAQRQATCELQEKYDKAIASIAHMEKRVVMAESMLEATLQYESGQSKALSSPKAAPVVESPIRRLSIFGWRDRNKGKQPDEEAGEKTGE